MSDELVFLVQVGVPALDNLASSQRLRHVQLESVQGHPPVVLDFVEHEGQNLPSGVTFCNPDQDGLVLIVHLGMQLLLVLLLVLRRVVLLLAGPSLPLRLLGLGGRLVFGEHAIAIEF